MVTVCVLYFPRGCLVWDLGLVCQFLRIFQLYFDQTAQMHRLV